MPRYSVLFRISRFHYSYSFCVPIFIGTAVNSICLRTCFFLFRLCFKAGAKLKLLFVSCKKNLKFFFEIFFNPVFSNFPSNLSMNFPCFAGCKCRKHFQISQAFSNLFFENFFSFRFPFPASISMNAFAVAGAKVEPFSSYPSFFSGFFRSFFDLFLNILITRILQAKLFYPFIGFFCDPPLLRHFPPVSAFPFYGVFSL